MKGPKLVDAWAAFIKRYIDHDHDSRMSNRRGWSSGAFSLIVLETRVRLPLRPLRRLRDVLALHSHTDVHSARKHTPVPFPAGNHYLIIILPGL